MMTPQLLKMFLQLAFEQGQAYQRIWTSLDLDNAINFSDLKYAVERGAQYEINALNFEGAVRMAHSDDRKLAELRKLISDRDIVAEIAVSQLGGYVQRKLPF